MPKLLSPESAVHRYAGEAAASTVEALADRIANVRHLREHHLWEILRTLPCLAEARDDGDFRRTFRALMERDDLAAASRALVAAARPACRLDRLDCIDGNWVARLLSEGPVRRTVAVHGDRVAAVMAALVALDRPGPVKH